MCVHELMHVREVEVHEVLPRGCLVCAWHGIEAQLGQKCVEHTFIDQNMSHMFNQE